MATFREPDDYDDEGDDDYDDRMLVADESYRGPPDKGFDDSQAGGIAQFKAGTRLSSGASGPTDFGFLLGSSASDMSSGLLKRCRSRGDQEMADAKRLALEGLQPPQPPLRPQQVLCGLVPGEDRGLNPMDPPVVRSDPYFWLRDDSHQNAEVKQLLQDEDTYCCRALASLKPLSDQLYREMRRHEKESSVGIPSVYKGGYAYYTRGSRNELYGAHYRAKCSGPGEKAPADVSALAACIGLQLVDEELLLDENDLNDDGLGGSRPYLSVCGPEPSADHQFIAFAEDFEGNDSYSIRFRNTMETTEAEGLNDDDDVELIETDGSIIWEATGHGAIYYIGHDHEYRGYVVRRHVLGTSQSSDTVVWEETDRRFSLSISTTSDEQFLIIQSASSETAEVYLLNLLNAGSSLVSVCPRQFGVQYEVDHRSGLLYILTDKDGASNSKLCCAPLTSIPLSNNSWQDVWVPDPPRTQKAAQTLYSVSLGGNDLFKTDVLRVHYTSYIVPGRDYSYHVPTRDFKLIKESGPENYNPALYRAERITSQGAKIPISLVYRADLHPKGLQGGPFPTILTGYGAYGACQDPGFDSNLLCLLDRGILYAVAHVRGGGELGRRWREEGRYFKVKNRFHDFIDAAETLISLGISEKSTLGAWGESSGGLLVSASMNLRPDLFKAVLLYVPFVDAISTMSDPSIPLTCGEWEELGNPNQRDVFYYMLEYSPYDNLRMQDYPAALVTASQNDTMVGYWEPLKFVSKLRRLKTDSNPVLLKVDFHAGHGGASDKGKSMQEQAQHFAFLIDQLGVET